MLAFNPALPQGFPEPSHTARINVAGRARFRAATRK